jgi:hypothetical protein
MLSGIMAVFGWGNSGVDLPAIGKILMLAYVIILGSLLYVIIYYWYGKDHKCPSCKKPFCLRKDSIDVINKEPVTVVVEAKTKNIDGDVIGTQEQYVPGERTTYRQNYTCKKCGETCHSTYSKDNPKL